MAGGADGDWLLAPFGQPEQGVGAVHFQGDAHALARFGQDLEGDFGQQSEAAITAHHQARQVVTGDVLHHLAAEAQVLAQAGDDPCTQHEIPYRTERGRLTRQHLPRTFQRLRQLAQWRASAGGDDQFGGVVADNPAMGTGIQYFACGFATQKRLAVGPLEPQRQVVVQRLVDLLQQAGAVIKTMVERFHFDSHQKRSSSGKGSLPMCTCIAPNSAQRCRVGMFLPGFSMPLGSKAAFTAWNRVSSSLLNWAHIWLIFSRPTPCSPVILPPTFTHSSRILPPRASARSSSPGWLASNRINGCMLPSPA